MRIHRLTLRDFRGVTDRTVAFAETGVTIVHGDNEAGKTSLVEALDLLLDYRDDSQARAVRTARPVGSDVGAFVEAELSAGPYRFTYAKRFHRDRTTTLHVTAPEPEQRVGRDAHDRVHAILDEHVDRQLWTALRLHQGVELDQADLSEGTSLAAALDTAAGAGLAGERESSVFARVRAEHERYATPRTGRPTRLLTAAVEAERDALARADALSTELDALDADVERDRALQRTIADRRAALRAARERADAAAADARLAEDRALEVDRLALEAELAEAGRDAARASRAARDDLAAELDAVTGRIERLGAALAEAGQTLADAEATATGAVTAQEASEAARATATTALRAAEDVREALLLHDQLAVLVDRRERAAAALDDLRSAEARLTGPDLDDDVLAAIDEAERAAATTAAALAADAPTVRVRALADLAVGFDDEPAADLAAGAGAERPVADALVVRIADLAEVEVAGGAPARARAEQHAEAVADLARACVAAGVADPDEARRVHRERREARLAARGAEALLGAVLAGMSLDGLEERIARTQERVGAAARRAPGDADAAEDAVRDARKALTEADDLATDARRARQRAEEAAAALRTETAALRQEAATLADRRDELVATLGAARSERPDADLATALADAEALAATARAAHAGALRALRGVDPAGARTAAEQATAAAMGVAAELRAAEDERRDVRSRLELRGEQGLHDAFEEARRAHERTAREHRRLRAQADAARLLHERMAANRDAARRAYAAPLQRKVERLAAIVFGEDVRIALDDDLRIARRTLRGITLDYDQLSSGAREQLAVLARLAVAAIVGRDGGVPLILDDALGYSDPGRLERLGAALRVGARDTQVIVLTCVPERYRHVGEATVVRL